MYVTVHLTLSLGRKLRDGTADEELDDLRRTLAALGVDLQPLHPEASSPHLAAHFYATAADAAAAEQVAAQLRRHPAVVAAYVKPVGGPPVSPNP